MISAPAALNRQKEVWASYCRELVRTTGSYMAWSVGALALSILTYYIWLIGSHISIVGTHAFYWVLIAAFLSKEFGDLYVLYMEIDYSEGKIPTRTGRIERVLLKFMFALPSVLESFFLSAALMNLMRQRRIENPESRPFR